MFLIFESDQSSIMRNVAIICGGFSSEYDISVKSARNIKANFPSEFNVYLIFLNREGWFVEVNEELIPVDISNLSFTSDEKVVFIDVAVVYTHGDPGENGKIQAYLEMINIPYINSGPLASQLSFDKWYCNQFLKGFGINVAKSIYLTKNEIDPAYVVSELGLPVFVKPCDSGSSFGISRVNNLEGIASAVDGAFKEGRTVVIESFLKGTEVTCGVYRSKAGIQALPLTEIVSKKEFFDYEAKYQGLSDEITPARIDDEIREEVQNIAKEIYSLLQLRSIARIDFMIVDNVPFVIEVNTTPGFSNESIVPKMINSANMTAKELWSQIITAELI